MRAKSYCRLGSLESLHRNEAGLVALDAADAALEASSEKQSQSWVEVWLDVQLERVEAYYWKNEVERGGEAVTRARPVLEARGTPRQKTHFYSFVGLQRAQASRYIIDDETLADLRAAWEAVLEGQLENEMLASWFYLGFGLLWRGDLVEAEPELRGCLSAARRAGDKALELRCLTYLALTHLRAHDVGAVGELVPQLEVLARELAFLEYEGMAYAMRSWMAWKEGDGDKVEELAAEAIERWQVMGERWGTSEYHYPFRWVCLWPVIAVRLARRDDGQAIEAVQQLLQNPQMRMPRELETMLEAVVAAWEIGNPSRAGEQLTQALELAEQLGFA